VARLQIVNCIPIQRGVCAKPIVGQHRVGDVQRKVERTGGLLPIVEAAVTERCVLGDNDRQTGPSRVDVVAYDTNAGVA
jgi:hypothetical protein